MRLPYPTPPDTAARPARFGSGNCKSNALESPRMPDARSVVVYSRKGCHLCEVVKESLVKLSRRGGFTWQEIDVDSDADLRRQFNDEVPVVFIDGRKAFKYRMDEQEFLRKLAS
jgi:glutaredoxin